jgi:hypothetical protein
MVARQRRLKKIRNGICVKCIKKANKNAQFCDKHRIDKNESIYAYRKKNPDKVHLWGKNLRGRYKLAAFNAYGGCRCACCSVTESEFLTIDHINGNGRKHRKDLEKKGVSWGNGFHRWLYQQGYPPGYRVLCMNCNFSLGQFGYCPHDPLGKH